MVWRKAPDSQDWGIPIVLPGTATNYLDTKIVRGTAWEYQIQKNTPTHVGYGYIVAGLTLPATEQRGKLILLVDQTWSGALRMEIEQLEQDLTGDGWFVWRHDIPRTTSVPAVKEIIKADYAADPANVKAVFLLGRIAVPYSGEISPDGHPTEHLGAWPADAFYGDLEGTWTDTSVKNVTASSPRNWNVPGDGKYDQSEIPGEVKLAIGRVDFFNMPGLDRNNVGTFPSELELLRQYLRKDHAYRCKQFTLPARGLVFNETGDRNGEAFAANAWRNYAPLLGPPSPPPLHYYQFLPVLAANGYQWGYATGGANEREMSGLGGTGNWNRGGSSLDFYRMDPQVGFVMLMGSGLGDWDGYDNLMRAVLATPSYGLACMYVGRPHWYFHHMGLGGTLGESLRLTQNNHANGLYRNQSNAFPGFVHTALMGDPTLRLHTVAPPTGVSAAVTADGAQLTWSPSPEPVLGYHVYRATDPAGPYSRLTPAAIPATNFLDVTSNSQRFTYMVRALKLQESPSGSYFNLSQGVFGIATVKPLVTLRGSEASFTLSWSSIPGQAYRVLSKHTLADTDWSQISPDIVATGTNTSWSCELSPNAGVQRFFNVEPVLNIAELRNLSLDATATNLDGLWPDGAGGLPAEAIDGDPQTYWDELDNQSLYRLQVRLNQPARVAALRILGWQQQNYAPKDFEVICDGRFILRIENAHYQNNWATVTLPPTHCTTVELRITGFYGASPAIRELEIYGQ
jgi:hypothetical protein